MKLGIFEWKLDVNDKQYESRVDISSISNMDELDEMLLIIKRQIIESVKSITKESSKFEKIVEKMRIDFK